MSLRYGIQFLLAMLALYAPFQAACQDHLLKSAVDPLLRHAELLYSDDFDHGLDQWKVELERPGSVTAKNGVLDIDVPAGATLWFRTKLTGPLLIEYQATAVSDGGATIVSVT